MNELVERAPTYGVNTEVFGVINPVRGPGRPPIQDGRPWDDLNLEEQIERVHRARLVLRRMSKHAIEHHFDMTMWGSKTKCGTVGCAAGQCALDPWFQRRGFGMTFNQGGYHRWTGLHPSNFFGEDLYYEVFVNDDIMSYETPNGDGKNRKPLAQHRLALRGINQYLKQLKAEA